MVSALLKLRSQVGVWMLSAKAREEALQSLRQMRLALQHATRRTHAHSPGTCDGCALAEANADWEGNLHG